MFFRNRFLAWDPSEYDGTEEVYYPAHKLWLPLLVMDTDTDVRVKADPSLKNLLVKVRYDGSVAYLYPKRFDSSCTMSFKDYPFDEQVCSFGFSTWAVDGATIQIQHTPEGHYAMAAEYAYYYPNSGWGLVDFTAIVYSWVYGCCPVAFTSNTFTLTLRRRYQLHICYLLIPNFLINIIAILCFLLPCDSTERCSLSINIYLSMVVYLLLLQELIPDSEEIPTLVIYIISTLVLISLSQIITILVQNLHHGGSHDNGYKVPAWVRRYIMHGLAFLLRMEGLLVSDTEHELRLKAASEISITGGDVPGISELNHKPMTGAPMATNRPIGTTAAGARSDEEQAPSSVPQQPKREKKISNISRVLDAEFERMQMSQGLVGGGVDGDAQRLQQQMCQNASDRITIADLKGNTDLMLYKLMRLYELYTFVAVDKERQKEIRCEWQQLAMLIDRLAFFVFLVMTIILWIIYYSYIPQYSTSIAV